MRRLLVLFTTAALLGVAPATVALAADPPLADTGAASDLAQTQATLNAQVTPRGSATSVRFDLGTSTTYGLQSASKDIGAGTDAVAVPIGVDGLTPDTTYHFRVVATSDGGTVQGGDATFKTAAVPPATAPPSVPGVSTGGVRDLSPTAATLTGTVTPHGSSTSVRFEYGTTSGYGASTATTAIGSGTRALSVSGRIGSGLVGGRRYHYRVVATNGVGTSRGADRSFVAATTPTAASLGASKDPVTYGGSVSLTGKLSGSRISNVRVRLQTTPFPFDNPFADTGNAVRSTKTGAYSFTLPTVTRTTRALVVADGLPSIVSKIVVVRSAARAGITSVTRRSDGHVVVRGRVIPVTADGIAALQRRSAKGAWLPLRRAHLRSDGRYTITLRARKAAMVVRTVGLPHDGGAHVRGTSRAVKVAGRR